MYEYHFANLEIKLHIYMYVCVCRATVTRTWHANRNCKTKKRRSKNNGMKWIQHGKYASLSREKIEQNKHFFLLKQKKRISYTNIYVAYEKHTEKKKGFFLLSTYSRTRTQTQTMQGTVATSHTNFNTMEYRINSKTESKRT